MSSVFDSFALVIRPLSGVTIHNVLLVDVRQSESGQEVLTIEHQGVKRELPGGGRWSEFSLRSIGRYGHLVPMSPPPVDPTVPESISSSLDVRGSYFRPYPDPSLRRLFDLDYVGSDGKTNAGWVCDSRPNGFYAPSGLIPGTDGNFVSDQTVEVTLRVPPEFVRECRRVQRSPEELLRGFVADAAGIQNYVNCPREDKYSSNGSDERDMAEAWINRAYGMDAIDIDAVESQDAENEDRQFERDDLSALLDTYVDNGGKADEVLTAVAAMVDKQTTGKETVPTEPAPQAAAAGLQFEDGDTCPMCGGTGGWPGITGRVECKPCSGTGRVDGSSPRKSPLH